MTRVHSAPSGGKWCVVAETTNACIVLLDNLTQDAANTLADRLKATIQEAMKEPSYYGQSQAPASNA